MADRGVSNAELAAAVDVDPATVSQWRTDAFPPNDERLKKIAELLGVTVAWLRYGSDSVLAKALSGELGEPTSPLGRRGRAVFERPPDEIVQVGAHRRVGGAARTQRINAFTNEMVRLGADDFEADYVRERSRTYVESVLFADGAPDLSEAELDAELEDYLTKILRTWVINHMKARGAKPAK
jgi:transcriptional regulator with XRE-family HTH domain